jgi:hypothetical protein
VTTLIELHPPHDAQLEMLRGRSRFNVVACGRRWGKTDAGIGLIVKKALDGEPCGWFAPTYKLLDEAWERFIETLPADVITCNKSERVIRLTTGGRIDFWTLAATTAEQSIAGRGRKYRRVVVDEAAMAQHLEQDWTRAIRPTLSDLQGDAYFLTTPRGQNYLYQLFRRGQSGEPGWASFTMPTARNPYIMPEEIAAAQRDLPKDAFAQEYLAEFLADAANPFGLTAIRACIADLGPGPVACWGVDLAKSVDWTVAIGLNAAGHVCAFQRWQSSWRETGARLGAMLDDAPSFVDETGVGNPIVEQLQAKCGSLVEGFPFTATSKQQLMEGLAWAIQNRTIAYPAGEIVNELEAFQYEYRPGGVRYTAPQGMHDDCVCALALAQMCRLRRRATTMTSVAVRDQQPAGHVDGDSWVSNACQPWGDTGWN